MGQNHAPISIATALFVLFVCVTTASAVPLPSWITKLIAAGPSRGTVIEEASYQGNRVFEVLPGDRAPDSGNEHVLRSEDGRVICEFGGFVGRVASGSCNISKIMYQRTIYPPKGR